MNYLNKMDTGFEELESSIADLQREIKVLVKDTKSQTLSTANEIERLVSDNLRSQQYSILAGINKEKRARLELEGEVWNLKTYQARLEKDLYKEGLRSREKDELELLNKITNAKIDAVKKQNSIKSLADEQNSSAYAAIQIKNTLLDNKIQEMQAINNSFISELAKQNITDPTSQEALNIKKELSNAASIEKSSRAAKEFISQIPLIGVAFGEVGPTITKQLKSLKQVFGSLFGASLTYSDGTKYTSKSAKADFNQEMAASAKRSKNFSEDKYKADITNTLTKAKETDAWEKYLKAKAVVNVENPTDANKKAFKEALKEAGFKSQSQARAAEAVEKQNQASKATLDGWATTTAALANIAQKLDTMVDAIAQNKSKVDTRLYGSTQTKKLFGSYWSQISQDLSATMLSPLLKQEDLANNVLSAVNRGIARDVQQFGMLETIKDKIATTFDVFDGTVLRLIKLQDNNTTAARLGMEASLTELLNEMYETTEYLSGLASSVRSDLKEAEALMSGENAVDFEYQVQKWLGSLYSVGMSDSAVSSIASTLGKLASGDIEGLSGGGTSNLLIMAANKSNLALSDILANGLDSSETNVLLSQIVSYMQSLADSSEGNLVVQQQMAKVFGLTASDLKAVGNLTGEYLGKSNLMEKVFKTGTGDTYNEMLNTLVNRADSMWKRTSMGEMLTNIWSNVQYSVAAGEASNPMLYILNKTADILNTFAGGIPIPYITTLATGVDPKLTVSNIMKSGAMVGGFTQSLISMIASAISNGGSGFGKGLLDLVGIKTSVTRGEDTSRSGTHTIYNASVSDTTESATSQGKESAEKQSIQAKEESTEVTNSTINENIVNIYNLLKDVIDGTSSLRVKLTEQPIEIVNKSTGSPWPASAGGNVFGGF